MIQKLFCLCAALLFAIATLNVASAEEAKADAAGCPCACAKAVHSACSACPVPCNKCNPCACFPPVSYRVGLFGVIRPVAYAPVYHPPVYRPGFYSYRYLRAPYCPPAYVW